MKVTKQILSVVVILLAGYGSMQAGDTQVSNPVASRSGSTGGNTSLSGTNKAYGDNMREVEPGVFAIYSGDVNQDGYIATDDVALIDNDNLQGASGNYLLTDLNGDTYVGVDDVAMCDNNNLMGIQIQRP